MVEERKEPDVAGTAHLATCPDCGRSSPASRLKCLYCGSSLELSDEQKRSIDPVFRKPEIWEPAFNVIYIPGAKLPEADSVRQAAGIVGLAPDEAEAVFEQKTALPIARVASGEEAEIIADRLTGAGLHTLLVTDSELALRRPPSRLRGLEFHEDGIAPDLFNEPGKKGKAFMPVLIVEGFLNRKRLESTEKRSGKGEKILDSAETGDDETVLDIYGPSDLAGYRIRPDGFDFSCLGERKAFTAAENIRGLSAYFREAYPQADFETGYRALRGVLGITWPQTHSTSAEGVERRGIGGYATRKVAFTDNEDQFTRYSRLLRILVDRLK